MNYRSPAEKILKDLIYATVATCDSKNNPWNTPLFFAYDQDLNMYWSSHPDSVHSKNISENGKVFIAVYNSKAGEGEGVGLYIQAKASVLTEDAEIKQALDLLGERRGKPFLHVEKFMGDGPQRIYKAEPLKLWTNDADQDADGDFIKDFRVSV